MKSIKFVAMAVVAIFFLAVSASQATTITLYGAWGSESGPTGVKCKGPSTAVCATIQTAVYPHPSYPDHLVMFDANQNQAGSFQVRFIDQIGPQEVLLDFMPTF